MNSIQFQSLEHSAVLEIEKNYNLQTRKEAIKEMQKLAQMKDMRTPSQELLH